MDFVAVLNACEAAWWTAMAAACWWKGSGKWKTVCRTAATFFVLFAATDAIEMQTGAWWKPWWLAVAKGICLMGLVSCGAWAWQIRRRLSDASQKPSVATRDGS